MTSILIIFLFILQMISFYIISLLNAKLGKLQDIERKQEQILKEIDDSFGAYIAEIKDENNRLLEELEQKDKRVSSPINEVVASETTNSEDLPFDLPKTFVSKKIAANRYSTNAATSEKKVPLSTKDKVIYYAEEGKSAIEIAKILQIGKTEVELFLKFKD